MPDPLKKLRAALAAPPYPFLVTNRSKRRVQSLIEKAGAGAVILNVGAGYTNYGPRVINLDIFNSGATSVIASAQALPFPDSIADLVILQGVLEHVEDAVVFPLKYADYFLERAPHLHRIAGSCYYIGRKA